MVYSICLQRNYTKTPMHARIHTSNFADRSPKFLCARAAPSSVDGKGSFVPPVVSRSTGHFGLLMNFYFHWNAWFLIWVSIASYFTNDTVKWFIQWCYHHFCSKRSVCEVSEERGYFLPLFLFGPGSILHTSSKKLNKNKTKHSLHFYSVFLLLIHIKAFL